VPVIEIEAGRLVIDPPAGLLDGSVETARRVEDEP
jgi:hypothetical protein